MRCLLAEGGDYVAVFCVVVDRVFGCVDKFTNLCFETVRGPAKRTLNDKSIQLGENCEGLGYFGVVLSRALDQAKEGKMVREAEMC